MPPTVTRQAPAATAQRAPTVSSSNGQAVEQGIKLLVYGRGKTGKNRLAATFPRPALLVGTEDGTKSICTGKRHKRELRCGIDLKALLTGGKENGMDFARINRSDNLDELMELIRSEGYNSWTMDTAGGLQDVILQEVLGLDNVPVQKSWGLTDRQTWGVVGMQFKERMRRVLDFADQRGTNIVVIAHERNFSEEGASDVMVASVGAALTPSVAGWLNAACDYICQTYIRQETVTEKKQQGNSTVTVTRKTGKKEYCLRVGPHEVFMTGFRLAPGIELPDSIVDPSYDKITRLIRGEKL